MEESNSRNWRGTDAEADGERFAEYLDRATAMEQIQSYKSRSYDLLDLDAGDDVLDAGCGIGDDVLALASVVGVDGRAVGVDNSDTLIAKARAEADGQPNVTFRVGDIYDMGFATDRFDASRADRILQHLEEPRTALEELLRVTRPGGRVGLTDPDWESLVLDAPGAKPPHELLDARYLDSHNPALGRKLYRLAGEAGLTERSVDPFLLTTTDFETVYEMIDFESWARKMQAEDRLKEADFRAWVERLRAADEADRFFGATPAYTVTGVVPESR